MAQDRTLNDLLQALRWRWPLALAIAAGITIGAVIYVEALPDTYEAAAVVSITPSPQEETAGSDTVRVVAPSYVAYLIAPSTVREVADELGISASDLTDQVVAAVAPDSGNLSITATDTDPTDAAAIANAFAERAVALSEEDRLLDADLIAPAVTPGTPSGPPRKLLEAAALLVGLLLGLAVALLIERGRPRIRSWRDISDLTGYPVIARIPTARIMRSRLREAFSDPSVGAAFRTLRTNVERALPEERSSGVALMVTSPSSGDGKSAVAALFAESLARLGSPTLLIDADLYRAGVSRQIEITDASTIDVLRNPSSLKSSVTPGWVDNLDVLSSRPGLPPEDLIALHFEDLLKEVRARYTYTVIDTPALLGTDEALTMATVVDGVVLVVPVGSVTRPVNESVLALEDLKAPVLGGVGNRLRRSEVGQTYR